MVSKPILKKKSLSNFKCGKPSQYKRKQKTFLRLNIFVRKCISNMSKLIKKALRTLKRKTLFGNGTLTTRRKLENLE